MKSLDFVFKESYNKCLGLSVEKVFSIKKPVQILKTKKELLKWPENSNENRWNYAQAKQEDDRCL